MKSWLTAATLSLGLALPAMAQERPNTILVLDASGSMWGQIDGVNKITIAREVVRDFVDTFPADQHLGLVTYGHRERGQCSDIQTMIEPAAGTGAEIAKIVDGLNPRGMTPMTDAVIAAAEELRHTEQAATVILISDGIETCNPDPCAAARALAEAGVDFTAHVIGFDVKGEAEALMQMQCIADETGGRFLTADNAAELTAALEQVAAQTADIFTFYAVQGDDSIGPDPVGEWVSDPMLPRPIQGKVTWEISDSEFSFVVTGSGSLFNAELPFGSYVVRAISDDHDISGQVEAVFEANGLRNYQMVFPPLPPALAAVTLRAFMDSTDGPLIETPITWELSRDGDSFEFDGNPGTMEVRAGSWTITGYHTALELAQSVELDLTAGEARTHVMVFETPKPTAELIAPDSAPAASFVDVSWTGLPPARDDLVRIRPVDQGGAFHEASTREGTTVTLRMPATPGTYELAYEQKLGQPVATKLIEVTPVDIRIIAPETAVAGSSVEVSWTGIPPARNDLVRVGPTEGSAWIRESATGNRETVTLRMPDTPGTYELRYYQGNLVNIIARQPIIITAD